MPNKQTKPAIVKKYANRRLYDTARSSYITMQDLYDMIKEDFAFKVVDAKSGKDITKQMFIQILSDKNSRKDSPLTVSFLKNLIELHGEDKQDEAASYLEHSLQVYKSIIKK